MSDTPYRGDCEHTHEPAHYCVGCFHGQHRGRCVECGRLCIWARHAQKICLIVVLGALAWWEILSACEVAPDWKGRLLFLARLPLFAAIRVGMTLLVVLPFVLPVRLYLSRKDRRLRAAFDRAAAESSVVQVEPVEALTGDVLSSEADLAPAHATASPASR